MKTLLIIREDLAGVIPQKNGGKTFLPKTHKFAPKPPKKYWNKNPQFF